jgi:dihydropyrimidinase
VELYTNILNGLPGVETGLPLMYKGDQVGIINIHKFVEAAYANTANLYGLERNGTWIQAAM